MKKVILAILMFASFCSAQELLPEAPSRNRFITKKTVALIVASSAAGAADFYFTHRNMASGRGRELDPIAAPLINQGTAGQVTFFVSQEVITIVASYLIHRSGRRRLAAVPLVFTTANATYGAIASAHGYKK